MFRLEHVEGGGGLPNARILSVDGCRRTQPCPPMGPARTGTRFRRLRFLDGRADRGRGDLAGRTGAGRIPPAQAVRTRCISTTSRCWLWIARAEDRVGLGTVPDWAPAEFAPRPGTPLRLYRAAVLGAGRPPRSNFPAPGMTTKGRFMCSASSERISMTVHTPARAEGRADLRLVTYGVIGCGMMGQEHLRNIALLPGTAIGAIFEPDAEMRARAGALAPGAEMVDSVEALLARDDLDCLLIASPNHPPCRAAGRRRRASSSAHPGGKAAVHRSVRAGGAGRLRPRLSRAGLGRDGVSLHAARRASCWRWRTRRPAASAC